MEKRNLEAFAEYDAPDGKKYLAFTNVWAFDSLIRKVIEEASYREKGDFDLICDSEVKAALEIIHSKFDEGDLSGIDSLPLPELLNRVPMYRNITRIGISKTVLGKKVFFCGEKVIVPKLAEILNSFLLYNDDKSIKEFLNYSTHEELIPIEEKIKEFTKKLNEATDYKNKLIFSRQLTSLLEAVVNGYYFDPELLKKYYNQAISMVEFREVDENERETGKTLTLKKI